MIIYVDELVAYSDIFRDQLRSSENVFKDWMPQSWNWKRRNVFFYQNIDFLRHNISDEGIRPLGTNFKSIMKFPTPTKTKAVQSFLRAVSYYRKFIHRFSIIGKPLMDLTKKENSGTRWHFSSWRMFWLRQLLPVLAHFNEDREIIVSCDASQHGIGVWCLNTQKMIH